MLSNILDRISFYSLFAVIVLLPVFFLPFTKIPIETSKMLLLVIGLAVSIIFWTAARFSDGKIILPKSWLLVSGFGIVLAFLLSALFSPASKISFFGIMLDTGTFYFILAGFLLMLVSSVVLKNAKNAKMVFWGIIASSAVLFIVQGLHLFMPETFSLGILGGKTDNILGSWNALGIFAGFSAVVSLFVLEFFSISKMVKMLLGALMILSVFLLAAVNFSTAWIILGIFALFIFVYKISFSSGKQQTDLNKRIFPIISFIIILVSLLFFTAGQFVGGFLPNHLGVSNFEIRPSFSATMSVAKKVLIKDPILGAGPNRFAEMWDIHKPAVINSTRFWDASFDGGSGLLPTFAITTGSLGILAWLAFLVFLIFAGFRSLFVSREENTPDMKTAVFFFMSLYLFISTFFYSTGPVIFLLAFGLLGIFIGLSASNKTNGEITMSFLDDPRKSFFSILLLVLIMTASASAGFKYIERFASVPYFQKALLAQTIDNAQTAITKAISLHSNDFYLRTYTQIYLIKLNSLITKGALLSETEKADLQASFDQAVNGAQMAIAYDQTNYLNFKMLGSIYEAVGPLGVSGAYDKALEAYKTASVLNPLNPGLKLAMSRASFANGKLKEAKDYAQQAFSLKQDYADVLIALSQIAKAENNNADALSYAKMAFTISPQDQNLAQYIDSLKNSSSIIKDDSVKDKNN